MILTFQILSFKQLSNILYKQLQINIIDYVKQLIFESCDDVEDWGSKWTVLSNIDFSEGDTMI
jgi:hypothetical protein